jgi:hypothetical protein
LPVEPVIEEWQDDTRHVIAAGQQPIGNLSDPVDEDEVVVRTGQQQGRRQIGADQAKR